MSTVPLCRFFSFNSPVNTYVTWVEASDIEDASAEELIKIAERNGIDLREYAV